MSLLDETFNDAELGNEDFKVLLEDHLEILKSEAISYSRHRSN